MELVSIIIPTHNYGHLLAETLDSLLAQTYAAWECLLIDDGSRDNTGTVAAAYVARDARFRYTYQDSRGVSAARNLGLAQAAGTYIQFLDADDLLLPRKLELHVAYLQQHPNIDLVYSDVRYFPTDQPDQLRLAFDLTDTEWMPRVDDAPGSAIQHLLRRNIMPIQAPLSRASLLRRVGGFDPAMRYCEDWDYWFRCAEAGGQLRFLDAPAAISLVRVHRVSASQNVHAMAGGGNRMTEKFVAYLQAHPHAVEPSLRTDLRRRRALDLIRSRHYAHGLALFLKTTAQPNSGQITYKEILYWLRATLLRTASQ